MLKAILNLEGAQKLTKTEQKSIQGGLVDCIDPSTNTCNRYHKSCAPPCGFQPIVEP